MAKELYQFDPHARHLVVSGLEADLKDVEERYQKHYKVRRIDGIHRFSQIQELIAREPDSQIYLVQTRNVNDLNGAENSDIHRWFDDFVCVFLLTTMEQNGRTITAQIPVKVDGEYKGHIGNSSGLRHFISYVNY